MKCNLSARWVIYVILAAAVGFLLLFVSNEAKAWQTGDTYGGTGDWTVTNPTAVGDQILTVNGNLNVDGELTIINATVRINSGSDGLYTVNVSSSGTLKIWGKSILTASSGTNHYKFTVYGTLHVNQSIVSEMWGDTASWAGGIQLYSDNAKIEYSNITLGKTAGIYVENSSAQILNCRIYANGGSGTSTYCYGIFASGVGGTQTKIQNCSIDNNTYTSSTNRYGTGIRCENQTSDDLICDNIIGSNGYAVGGTNYGFQLYLGYSNTTMRNNIISYGIYGIFAAYSNPPTIKGGTFTAHWVTTGVGKGGCYNVYALYSNLSFDGVFFTFTGMTNMGFYGIYLNSYSGSDISNCTFDYEVAGATSSRCAIYATTESPVNVSNTRITMCNASTTLYGIYATKQCPVNITNCNITIINTTSTTYGIYSYVNYRLLDMTGCNISISNTTSSAYGISSQSYSPVSINRSFISLTNCSSSTYGIMASSYSDLDVVDLRIVSRDIKNSIIHIQCSAGNSNITNVEVDMEETGDYDSTGIWVSGIVSNVGGGGLSNNSTLTNIDIKLHYTSFTKGSAYGIRASNTNFLAQNCTVDFDVTGYNFYAFHMSGGLNIIRNCTLGLDYNGTAANGWGYAFYHPAGSGSADFSTAASGRPGVILIENCTGDARTRNSGYNGVSWFGCGSVYMDVRNCTFSSANMGGLCPLQFFDFSSSSKVYINDTTIDLQMGGGLPGAPALVTSGEFDAIKLLELNRANLTLNLDTDPTFLVGFSVKGACGEVRFISSGLDVEVGSDSTGVVLFDFKTATTTTPVLDRLFLKDSDVTVTARGSDDYLYLIRMAADSALGDSAINNSKLELSLLQPSVTESRVIEMVGVNRFGLEGTIKVNAPDSSVTEVYCLWMERTYASIENLVFQCNGEGRITGISCDFFSRPVISDTNFISIYTALRSHYHSYPSLSGTTFGGCTEGALISDSSNASFTGCRISTSGGALVVEGGSWATLVDTRLEGAVPSIFLDGGSTAVLVNCTFDQSMVSFGDGSSRLVVGWWLTLRTAWQNDAALPGGSVTVKDVKGAQVLSATSDEKGMLPRFVVVEYIKTMTAKDIFAPYNAKAERLGMSGSLAVPANASAELTIKVTDDRLPSLSVFFPLDGHVQNYVSLRLYGVASDVGSGLATLEFSLDGSTWQVIAAEAAWEYSMEVPEGDYMLSVRLTDLAGNSVTVDLNITIDLTPPAIEVFSPGNDTVGNIIKIRLIGQVEPGSSLTINFVPVSVGEDGSFDFPVMLTEGANRFVLFARDRAGNANSTSWTLLLDIAPPALSLNSPSDGLLTKLSSVTVAGKTEPGSTVTVNGAVVTVGQDGSFSLAFGLTLGTNVITVAAIDAVGNARSITVSVVMDNQLALALLEPADGLVTNRVIIALKGSTDPGAQVALNGANLPVAADGSFSVTVALTEGENLLKLVAMDRAGNTVTLNRKVELDTTPPALQVASPADGARLRSLLVTVSGTCEAGINLTINGKTVNAANGTFSVQLTLAEGASTIELSGTDAAGNTALVNLKVTVDLTPPPLNVAAPATGLKTSDRSIEVSGTTEPGALVTINGIPLAADADGRFSETISLNGGRNTITVSATDAAGNSQTKTVDTNVVTPPASEFQWWGEAWTAAGQLAALLLVLPLIAIAALLLAPVRPKRAGRD